LMMHWSAPHGWDKGQKLSFVDGFFNLQPQYFVLR